MEMQPHLLGRLKTGERRPRTNSVGDRGPVTAPGVRQRGATPRSRRGVACDRFRSSEIFKYGPSTVTAVCSRLKKMHINSNSSSLAYERSTIDSFQSLSCKICYLVGCYRSGCYTGVRFLNAASYLDAPVTLKPAETGENEQNMVKKKM